LIQYRKQSLRNGHCDKEETFIVINHSQARRSSPSRYYPYVILLSIQLTMINT